MRDASYCELCLPSDEPQPLRCRPWQIEDEGRQWVGLLSSLGSEAVIGETLASEDLSAIPFGCTADAHGDRRRKAGSGASRRSLSRNE